MAKANNKKTSEQETPTAPEVGSEQVATGDRLLDALGPLGLGGEVEELPGGGRVVSLKNIGAVSSLSIPIPEAGGLVVLRGQNGIGKTTALSALQSVATGKGRLEVTDGELVGTVEGYGVTVTVAQSTRRRGEAEVVTLAGPGDVSTLVDPQIDDAGSADAWRIKALLSLVKAKCDASTFWPLLGGKEGFEAVVDSKAAQGDDPVRLADRIKRAIEAAARSEEAETELFMGRSSELLAQNANVDVEGEHDSAKLSKRWQEATAALESTKAKAEAFADAVVGRQQATEQLTKLRAIVPDVDQLVAAADQAAAESRNLEAIVEQRRAAVVAAQKGLADAEAELKDRHKQRDAAEHKLSEARTTLNAIADVVKVVERDLPDPVTQADVVVAEAAQRKAMESLERGVVIREAVRRRAEAEQALKIADSHRLRGESLRASAANVDVVLSTLVGKANEALRVEAGRLVTTTRRGKTYFAKLSQGQRWKLALGIAIKAVGPGGMLVCPQEAFEGLDPLNVSAIVEQLTGTGVVMFTAKADAQGSIVVDTLQAPRADK